LKKEQLKGNLMLLTAAMIWGCAFVAQSVGMDYLGVLSFSSARALIACLTIVPIVIFFDRRSGRKPSFWGTDDPVKRKRLLTGGALCGVALTGGSVLQQAGIALTAVGKAGFITALYIVIIPVIGLFFRRRPGPLVWCAVGAALAGLYLLCMNGGFSVETGDIYLIMSAFVYSIHILLIDRFSDVDGVRLSCLQFFVFFVLSFPPALIFEKPALSGYVGAAGVLLYAGVLSSGVAFTLQILAQKLTGAVVGSLLMSLESVFAALAGWAILGQTLSARELLGCALMFAAIVMAQLPVGKKAAVG